MIDFVNDPIEQIAQQLLGCVLSYQASDGFSSGIIVDTEVYYGDIDEASHAYGGKRTPRMEAMLLEGGHFYLYEMRGHILMNIVCGKPGETIGIMIRAIEPLEGIELMETRRHTKGVNLTNGPGKLCQAVGIEMTLYGSRVNEHLTIDDDTKYTPIRIVRTHRIGIPNKGKWTHAPLRYYVEGNPYCSNIKKNAIKPNHGWK